MHEHNRQPGENPLEDLADELSRVLGDNQKELNAESAQHVQAGQVWMRNSAARTVDAHAVHSEDSALGLVRANTVDVNKSASGFIVAQDVHLDDSTNTVTIAKTAKVQNSTSVLLIAGRIEGDVKSVLTPWSAFAVGAGIGVVIYLLKNILFKISKSVTR
ncbi:MAG: hypothetical protein R2911_15230 [Caldilineaceae bacterium]